MRSSSELPPNIVDGSMKKYVYKLIDPSTNQVFYVGQGTGGRVKSHYTSLLKRFPECARSIVIKNYRDLGFTDVYEIVADGLTSEEANVLEKNLIDAYGRKINKSGILENLHPGGQAETYGLKSWSKLKSVYSDHWATKENSKVLRENRHNFQGSNHPVFAMIREGRHPVTLMSKNGTHPKLGLQPWDHPNATPQTKEMWKLASRVYLIWEHAGKCGYVNLHSILQDKLPDVLFTRKVLQNMITKFTVKSWIPKSDPAWVSFYGS